MFEHCTFKNNAIIIMHTFDGVYLNVNIFCYVCYIFIHQFKKKWQIMKRLSGVIFVVVLNPIS